MTRGKRYVAALERLTRLPTRLGAPSQLSAQPEEGGLLHQLPSRCLAPRQRAPDFLMALPGHRADADDPGQDRRKHQKEAPPIQTGDRRDTHPDRVEPA